MSTRPPALVVSVYCRNKVTMDRLPQPSAGYSNPPPGNEQGVWPPQAGFYRPPPLLYPPYEMGFNYGPAGSLQQFDSNRPPPPFFGQEQIGAVHAFEHGFGHLAQFRRDSFDAVQGSSGGDAHAHNRAAPGDAEAKQRHLDQQWLSSFLSARRSTRRITPCVKPAVSVSEVKDALYSAARLLSDLTLACQALTHNIENEREWTETYSKAVVTKAHLQEKMEVLGDESHVDVCKRRLEGIRKRRSRIRRKKRERVEDRREEEARVLEKEATIDKWRMKRIREVEDKKREMELREAADSVLSEVRKKQADSKRMVDILRSLEKLRKLRKEAAARKGVFPEKEADEAFEGHVDRLRKLIKKRTVVYAAEENTLRVMLEGEQEEERERHQKKEREKQLQKKRELESILFGDEMHPEHPLQPYRQYYLQAESSLHTLVQTRRGWDQYLVSADHPDGSSIPQFWVFPEPPADEVWATALEKEDAERN